MDAQKRISLLRQNHRIVPVPDGQGGRVCQHDGVRVWPVSGGHRHDVTQMQRLNIEAANIKVLTW